MNKVRGGGIRVREAGIRVRGGGGITLAVLLSLERTHSHLESLLDYQKNFCLSLARSLALSLALALSIALSLSLAQE
jgi:hypothetical protein